MKKLSIALVILFICNFAVLVEGQTANPEDLTTLNKIAQEHQNTRKYFSDELTRQRTEFFKQVDDRANYYEETVSNLLTKTVTKLVLLWGGIMLFFTSFNNFLRNRIEKKRYKKLKDNIKEELKQELMKQGFGQQTQQNVSISKENIPISKENIIRGQTGYSVEAERIVQQAPKPKISTLTPRKEKKVLKQLNRIDNSMRQIDEKRRELQNALGITPVETNNTEYIYDENIEVDY